MSRLDWYWQRLLAMDPQEVGHRVLQKVRLATGEAGSTLGDFHLGAPATGLPLLSDRDRAPTVVREAVTRAAASIRLGQWPLFGWKRVHVPSPPVWHRDYLHGSEAPSGVAAQKLNYRTLPPGADARCIWETNRWSEMVQLAQNAWLNGALEDAELAQQWLRDWHDKNPMGIGINWCSSLEAGIRLMNFSWFDALIRSCESADLNAVQDELAQQIVPGHAWWIWRHRSFGSSANNHLLGELAGLVLAARRWPSVAQVSCRAEVAWANMSDEVLRQFAEDGGNREQALHYHHFAWEMVWQAKRVMEIDHGPVHERLQRAARFYCDVLGEGEPWDFGDSDDAQITPMTADRPSAPAEWKAWMLGEAGGATLRYWLGEPPTGIPRMTQGTWKAYPETGLAVQTVHGWSVRVDGSPLGFGKMAAHGHLDALHVSLWLGEHALVVDPGTAVYFADSATRAIFASWELHNGPLGLSGRAHPNRIGPFLWTKHHAPPELVLDGDLCVVRLATGGSLNSRSVQYRPDADAWQITDQVGAAQTHVVRWRLAPQWAVASQSATEVTVEHPECGAAKLSVRSDGLVSLEVGEGPVSPHFGDIGRGVVLSVTFEQQLVSQWQRVTTTRHK